MKTTIQHIKLTDNPFILFLPFLALYILLTLLLVQNKFTGDETRYLIYAEYIITGGKHFLTDFNYLGNGPGYPLLLVPFKALHLPVIYVKLLNAVFYYLSLVLLFKILLKVATCSKVYLACLFWACYINLYELVPLVAPEIFSVFLVCLIIFFVQKAFDNGGSTRKNLYFVGLLFGCLAFTKPIFGYVLMVMLSVTILLRLFNREIENYKKTLIILLVALATTLPYLVYTYCKTGKIFYWSSYGGNNLYWMSSPALGEYGDWFRTISKDSSPDEKSHRIEGYEKSLLLHHQKDFDSLNNLDWIQQDEAFKKMATKNIQEHPLKFIQNCFSNLGRMLFNTPYSYTLQRPSILLRLPMNGILTVLSLFCLLPTFLNWKKISFSIRFMLFFALLYIGGSLLGSAETRMFAIIAPVFLVWLTYIFQKTVKLSLKNWK